MIEPQLTFQSAVPQARGLMPFFLLTLLAIAPSASGSPNWHLAYGGFISAGALIADGEDHFLRGERTIELFEAALNLSVFPFKKTLLTGQAFAYRYGQVGDFEPKIDYLFVDYEWSRQLGVRVGRIRRKEGFFTESIDIDAGRTFILLPGGIYQPELREVIASIDGFSFYGRFDSEQWGSWEYEIYGGDINFQDDSAGRLLLDDPVSESPDLFADPDISVGNVIGGKLLWNSPWGARLAYSFARFNQLTPSIGLVQFQNLRAESVSDLDRHTFSAEFTWHALVLRAEYIFSQSRGIVDRLGGQVVEDDLSGGTSYDDGWYLSAESFLDEKWSVGAYYTEDYDDITDRGGSDLARAGGRDPTVNRRNMAFAVSFRPLDDITIKAEVHWVQHTKVLRLPPFRQESSQEIEPPPGADADFPLNQPLPSKREIETGFGFAFKATYSF